MTPGDRLQKARKDAGYPSAAAAARAMSGANRFTYSQHENGTRDIPRDAAIRYAKLFRVSVDYLLTGKHPSPRKAPEVPVVGYVGAGAEVFAFDDYPQGGGLEMVEPPPATEGTVAVVIRGDSQYPLQEGWLIFYRKDQEGVPQDCIGKLCVVKVSDGATLLKTVRRGTSKHHFRLESWNAPPREDVVLEWASRVLDIRPR